MIVRYTLDDASRWAQFSGDNNPIHFNAAYSAAAGLPALTVHGMRAMLDLKAALSQKVDCSLQPDGWWRFTGRLRAPIEYKQPITVTSECNARGVIQATLADAQQQLKLSGKVQAATLTDTGVTKAEKIIDSVAHDYQQFMALFDAALPQVADWIFLDALLFRELIDAPQIMALLTPELPGIDGQDLNDMFKRLTVVQTHHEVWFDASLLETRLPPGALRCVYYSPLVVGDLAQGATVAFSAGLFHQSNRLMNMAVTLKITSLQ